MASYASCLPSNQKGNAPFVFFFFFWRVWFFSLFGAFRARPVIQRMATRLGRPQASLLSTGLGIR